MKTALLILAGLLVLSACGADGAPTAPAANGVDVSGTVQFGVTG